MTRIVSPVEERFRAQYAGLDDEVLREIARGDTPWKEDGHYLHAARLAAGYILEQRGATDIPHVPTRDPALGLSRRFAAGIALLALCLAATAAALYPGGLTPSETEACSALDALLAPTDFSRRYNLSVNSCELDGRSIRIRACLTLDADDLARLKTKVSPLEQRTLRRFASNPTAGRHCPRESVEFGEVVERPDRPWFVRLKWLSP